jgi:hypothetical protein
MRDFTLSIYEALLKAAIRQGYMIIPNLLEGIQSEKKIILRHDVDAYASRSVLMAGVESSLNVKASYFFKIHPSIFKPELALRIFSQGHSIGYHYEDLSRNHGNFEKAISDFERNLDAMRKVVPVNTICADGNPMSKYNNLWLWEKFDYKRFGISCEMYLDINYEVYAYYTDTGRNWHGNNYNVWDHVQSHKKWPVYKSTSEIIEAIQNGTFPSWIEFNIHPQRWNDHPLDWTQEYVMQNIKNKAKYILIKFNKRGSGTF